MILDSQIMISQLILLLFGFLIVLLLIILFLMISGVQYPDFLGKKKIKKKRRKKSIPGKKFFRSKSPSKSQSTGNSFQDQVGELIVSYMIRISKSTDKSEIKELVFQIRKEAGKNLTIPDLSPESRKILNTVMTWSSHFKIDRHVNDVNKYGDSSQIVYNTKTRDFRLRVLQD